MSITYYVKIYFSIIYVYLIVYIVDLPKGDFNVYLMFISRILNLYYGLGLLLKALMCEHILLFILQPLFLFLFSRKPGLLLSSKVLVSLNSLNKFSITSLF